MNNHRLTITEVAKALGITPRTIMRWEKAGKIRKPKRDWRGWRFYLREDLDEIRKFYETVYEYSESEGPMLNVDVAKNIAIVILALATLLTTSIIATPLYADSTGIKETEDTVDIVLDELPVIESSKYAITEPVTYTLGPDDVISIEVRRHPEFSGEYTINSEGKIEYKYIGDLIVEGLNKTELKERLTSILSDYIIEPEVDVQIVAYLSKVFYVVGEVHRPGKFYMRGDTITVREALVQAGLPTDAAAMRRCRLISPSESKKNQYIGVNVYSLLYEGNLKQNLTMKPGEVLYIPATAIAKALKVITPATSAAGEATRVTASGAAAAGAF